MSEHKVERIEAFLSTFSCKRNPDVEHFLRCNAIDFSNKGVARTHLITANCEDENTLLGYFALTNKILAVPCGCISKSLEKKISRFGVIDERSNSYTIPIPLIAQLGKNDLCKTYLSGDELLTIACRCVSDIQFNLGGRFTYIECEDTQKLTEFYERNGFLDISIQGEPRRTPLVQMIKYL